jgi:hypothetical protein
MNEKEFNEMKLQHDKYKALSKEDRENVQIEICKLLDEMQQTYSNAPMLAYFHLNMIKNELRELNKTAWLISIVTKMFDI